MEPGEAALIYETGDFRIDAAGRVLRAADGTRVSLSSRAFELLLLFLRHPGELLDKDRLMKAGWPDTVVEENNLNQCIGAIRKALGESPGDRKYLVTEPGRGYRFVAPVRRVADASPPNATRRRGPMLLAAGFAVLVAAAAWWARAPRPPAPLSIAVLPFENRSELPENGYLAQGIQDELITFLTRIGDLRVVSRNSTQRYATGTTAAPQIGRELGVAYLLEGSVQRAGDRVRVNVTLLDAAADRHLWASSYERSAREVFAVETEVAQAVVEALAARRLTPRERTAILDPPTASPEAYDAYLRARAFAERTTRTEAEILAAIGAFEEAVRRDPKFAAAWAQLSRRHSNFFSLGYDRSGARRALALRALVTAETLASDRVETQVARAYFLFVVEGDLEGAERLMLGLESRYPGNADVAAGMAQITRELGQLDRSADYARRTLALDPLSPYRRYVVCGDYLASRELTLAAQTCDRALELLPGDAGILALKATLHQARGELARSRKLLQSLAPEPGDWRTLRAMSRQLLLDRQPRGAIALLGQSLAPPDALGTRRGLVRRWLADAQRQAGEGAAARASYAAARSELQSELERQPSNPLFVGELAIVAARLGERGPALDLAQRCLQLARASRRMSYIADCGLARIQVALATNEPGLQRLLDEALHERGALPPLTVDLIRVDPDFDAQRATVRTLTPD